MATKQLDRKLESMTTAALATSTKPHDRPSEITLGGTRQMSADEWAGIADNPRQRDTMKHAKSAKHLRVLHPAHAKVNMAVLPDGRTFKLDGHTRSFMWQAGMSDRSPAVVLVDTWLCPTVEHVLDLYTTFDNRAAVESTSDELFGIKRELLNAGVDFRSKLLTSVTWSTAMRYAHGYMYGNTANLARGDLRKQVHHWLPELKLLDRCAPVPGFFSVGTITASLLTFRRYGPEAVEFWSGFSADTGSKVDGERDAIQALSELAITRKASRNIAGHENIDNLIRTSISAFERHQRRETYKGNKSSIKAYSPSTLQDWLLQARLTTRTWH